MSKVFLLAAAIAVVLTMIPGVGYAQTATVASPQAGWYCPWHNQATGQGYARQNTGGWYCPWMGSGYQQGQRRGMGYGMMGRGGGMGYGREYRGRGVNSYYGSSYRNSTMQSRSQ